MTDNIRPEHYRTGEIDLFESWYQTLPWEQFRAVMVSHAEKYMKRIKNDPVEDLEKARYVLWRLREKEIERTNGADTGHVEMTVTKDGIHAEIATVKVAGVINEKVYIQHHNLLEALLDKGYGWLARDEDGELWAHEELPHKEHFDWESNVDVGVIRNDNFPQIQWEDSEPTKIADLLATYENGGESGN